MKFLYLLSTGVYSDYEVEYIAIHERKFTETELNEIIAELKTQPITENTQDALLRLLESKGFQIAYPVGEFDQTDYETRISVHIPWRAKNDPNPMREGFC